MKAHQIRKYGGMFYVIFGDLIVLILMTAVILIDRPYTERVLYNLFVAKDFFFFPAVLLYIGFLSLMQQMAIVYHELGHAVAMRHYGVERIAILIRGLFSGICIGCSGDGETEESDLLTDVGDAVTDVAGGILCGAMILIIFAITQCLGLLIIFSIMVTYSAMESNGEVTMTLMTENWFDGKGFMLMNELNDEDMFQIYEELYVCNPT